MLNSSTDLHCCALLLPACLQFWTTSSGIVMCCDNCVTDALGQASAADFIGRSFSSLCTDVGGVNTSLAAAATADEATEPPTFKTQVRRTLLGATLLEHMLFAGMCCSVGPPTLPTHHLFLAADVARLPAARGCGALPDLCGHTDAHSDCRSSILHAHVLTDSTAVMVLDHKGRIQHATAKLAGLLGYPVSKLRSLDFNTLLPQPVCQMHGAWFKVSALGQSLSLHPPLSLQRCPPGAFTHPRMLLT